MRTTAAGRRSAGVCSSSRTRSPLKTGLAGVKKIHFVRAIEVLLPELQFDFADYDLQVLRDFLLLLLPHGALRWRERPRSPAALGLHRPAWAGTHRCRTGSGPDSNPARACASSRPPAAGWCTCCWQRSSPRALARKPAGTTGNGEEITANPAIQRCLQSVSPGSCCYFLAFYRCQKFSDSQPHLDRVDAGIADRSVRRWKYACTATRRSSCATSPRKCAPSAAEDVKFTRSVPEGTSWLVNSVPPLSSR